jgi:antitoxin VapB
MATYRQCAALDAKEQAARDRPAPGGYAGRAMNIASSRIDELAQRLSRLTGEDPGTVVERATEERLSRLSDRSAEDRRAALQEFFDLAAQMPTNDTRSIDEITGYGRNGLPTE